ncbi:MAG TPA: peptidoglycan DD-metalloendopeptidase family protein [Saprospiraceae bacterium]|nr:peptidoglycan DD-metalloendopeptidase family protein [Saprospiraceae bacterium]
MNAHNIPPSRAETIIGNLSQVINLNSIRAGNTVGFAGLNPCLHPDYLIYEVDDSKFITCELRGDLCASVVEKPTSYVREQAMGIIESTLWDALQAQNLSLDLIDQMEDALSSSVDFHHVQKGNTFKLIFDRRHLDGQPTPSGRLIAAYFDTGDREAYAISYLVQNKKGFYDLKGSPMASKFLQAPVRFSRISSGFNMKRFHPVLKYHRPHLGTDYAAPYGTPIMSVGAGVVESASYTAGNGNYVKIRHDKTYQTQYLHMSKFAKGIRRGAQVSQGQVIGYVGSTGLASGPHVCFRFWKDGRQVNHRALRFPSPDPLPSNLIQDYYKHRDSIVKVFDSMQFNTALNDRS